MKSDKDFEMLKSNGLTLINFGAPWCTLCRLQEPTILQLSSKFKEKVFITGVNIDQNREIALSLGIKGIPTLIIYIKGREVQRFVGLQSRRTLSETLRRLLK
jgi:thioredoxin 1